MRMGWAKRATEARRGLLAGLRVVVDVQHLYRTGDKARDQGAVYRLADGRHLTEGQCAAQYGAALSCWLRGRGAAVLTNDTGSRRLVGPYSRRHAEANAWAPHVYLACHLNAGRGTYCAVEYMAGSAGARLADWICRGLLDAFPAIRGHKAVALMPGQRGAVCISGVAHGAPLILEPLFGDTPSHQFMLTGPELKRLGETIGQGLMAWWRATDI